MLILDSSKIIVKKNKEKIKKFFNLKDFGIVKILEYIIVASLGFILAVGPYFLRLVKVCFVVALLTWVLRQIAVYKKEFFKYLIPNTFLNKAIGLFIGACLLSVLFSLDFKYSQRVFFERYLPFISFFFIAVGITKENFKYAKFLAGIFLVSAFYIGVGGIWDYFTIQPARLFTSFGNKYLGLYYYFALVTPLSVTLAIFSKNKALKIIALFTSIVIVPCLVWNFYRGAIIAFIFSVLVISWFKNKKIAIGIVLLFLICFFVFLPPRYLNRMGTTVNPDTWGDRVPMWKSAVSMWKDYPIFGVGIRKYKDLMFIYEPSSNSIKRKHDHAHNTYFQVLAEGGTIGILTFIYLFFSFFKKNWLQRKKIFYSDESSFLGGVIAVIISCLIFSFGEVLFILTPNSVLLWLIFGLGVGRLERLLAKENTSYNNRINLEANNRLLL